VPAEHRVDRLLGTMVAVAPGQVANDHTATERSRRLEVGVVRSVVTDVRVREGDDLTRVGRIGHDLLVPSENRVEDHLTAGDASRWIGTEQLALERAAVGEHQPCFADHGRTCMTMQASA
jgi:hypothetical protein